MGSPSRKKGAGGGKAAATIDSETVQITKAGVVVQKPEHLSNFTIDKPTIDFFKQASAITGKLKVSERNRKRAMD